MKHLLDFTPRVCSRRKEADQLPSPVWTGMNPFQMKLSAHPQLKSYGKRGWYFADLIPPCLQTNVRLSDDEPEYEEGPDTEVTRPLYSNGAAVEPA